MSAPPRSILKKRPIQEEDAVEEVPAESGPSTDRGMQEPESETGSEDDDQDSFDDETDEEEDDEDEDEIREMGQDRVKPPKSTSLFRRLLACRDTDATTSCNSEIKNTTLRPTAAPAFSLALNHLLNLPPTASSLAPRNAPPSTQTQRLERRAKTLIKETKANHLARGHVRDVIVGWGARPALPFSQWDSASAREFERAQNGEGSAQVTESGAEREKRLRRLAQRGVVRLFNAIGAAQGAPDKAEREEAKRRKLEGNDEVTAIEGKPGGNVSRRPNVLGGRGKGEAREFGL